MGAVLFRQQQPRRVHVGAGDMRMDVDGARHDDAAARVEGLVGAPVRRRGDDAVALQPEIADLVAAVGGIEDAAAGDLVSMPARPPARGSPPASRRRSGALGRATRRDESSDAADRTDGVVIDAGPRASHAAARQAQRRSKARCRPTRDRLALEGADAQITHSVSPAAISRRESKRQGSCSGWPRAKPVRSGNPVIQPQTCLNAERRCPARRRRSVENRVVSLRSRTRPWIASMASGSKPRRSRPRRRIWRRARFAACASSRARRGRPLHARAQGGEKAQARAAPTPVSAAPSRSVRTFARGPRRASRARRDRGRDQHDVGADPGLQRRRLEGAAFAQGIEIREQGGGGGMVEHAAGAFGQQHGLARAFDIGAEMGEHRQGAGANRARGLGHGRVERRRARRRSRPCGSRCLTPRLWLPPRRRRARGI